MIPAQRSLFTAIAVILITLCCIEVMRGEDPTMANREALARDLTNLALRAQEFYHRPTAKGGGQGSFVLLTADAAGLAKLTSKVINSNGTYSISMAGTATQVVLRGMGTQKGGDGNVLYFRINVFADSMALTMFN